jgi:bifunctional non-homologous end joining protein LigD
MTLTVYRRKRDFKKTREPQGKVRRSKRSDRAAAKARPFVVQKHAATRLHYDLRLELDGVLKSWAVPKGPSLDPTVRALAVEVEDHPREYASFEGVIPAGQYGAGRVIVWDRGEWIPESDPRKGYRDGSLKFELRGEKLRGSWALVRMRDERPQRANWLLIKHRDAFARSRDEFDPLTEQPESVLSGRRIEDLGPDPVPTRRARAEARAAEARSAPSSNEDGARIRSPRAARRPPPAAQGALSLPRAAPAAMPERLTPQLATLVAEPPSGPEWGHEIKYDGYRLLAFKGDGAIRLVTRREQDWTHRYPRLAAAVGALPVREAVLDGEVVALDPRGRMSFQSLQNAMRGGQPARLAYYVFDLPYCEGADLRLTPLGQRKALLEKLLAGRTGAGRDRVQFSEHFAGDGRAVLRSACKLGYEGIVSKRLDSPYETRRTRTWLKSKCARGQEFVIGGFSDPAGSRVGFGALVLGYYDPDGQLRYCGRVGTGFDQRGLKDLHRRLKALETDSPPFVNPPRGSEARGVHWVRPTLVAQVSYLQLTSDGILRHAVFRGLREDKPARDVKLESSGATAAADAPSGRPLGDVRRAGQQRPRATTRGDASGASAVAARAATRDPPASGRGGSRPAAQRGGSRRGHGILVGAVRLTNPERILFPDVGLTKLTLARYYELASEHMLPHVRRRPVMLRRCPDGQQSACFYQKHWTQTLPGPLHSVSVREKGKSQPYIVLDDADGLVSLAQVSALEVHTWGSRAETLETPDQVIFDLDPGPDVPWKSVVEAALELRERLGKLDLVSFVKTSGGKGLHIVVPLAPRAGWDETYAFAQSVAESMEADDPQRYITTMSKARRTGRIYIDYHRNGRGATCVSVFSPRARPGAPVSAPLSWKELPQVTSGDEFRLDAVVKHLRARARCWREFFAIGQAVSAALLKRLGRAAGMAKRG